MGKNITQVGSTGVKKSSAKSSRTRGGRLTKSSRSRRQPWPDVRGAEDADTANRVRICWRQRLLDCGDRPEADGAVGQFEKYDRGGSIPAPDTEEGSPIRVDPDVSGEPAPSWMGYGGERTTSSQFGGRRWSHHPDKNFCFLVSKYSYMPKIESDLSVFFREIVEVNALEFSKPGFTTRVQILTVILSAKTRPESSNLRTETLTSTSSVAFVQSIL